MNKNAIDLSVVIVNYNTKNYLGKCVQSLQETIHRLTYEIIVVDNHSSDGSVDMIRREIPSVVLIANEENTGLSRASNQGARISRGRYILLLNNDTVALPGAIETMVSIMDQSPGIGLLGCRLLNGDGTLQQSFGWKSGFTTDFFRKTLTNLYEKYKNPLVGKFLEWRHSQPKDVDWVKGACMLFRRQAFFDAGLMDETFFMYMEEVDVSITLLDMGWRVRYTPAAEIIHFGGISTQSNHYKSQVEYRKSQLYFFNKHYGPRALKWLKLYLTLKMHKNLVWSSLKEWAGVGKRENHQQHRRYCEDVLYIIKNYK